jgi:hypothetical protein
MSVAELQEILAQGNVKLKPDQQAILDSIDDKPEKRQNKYNNQPVTIDGLYFQSQAEANRWFELQLLVRGKVLIKAERQKRYKLPGGVVYVLDHLLTYPDGRQEAEEVKGMWTREAINKCKQFRQLYPEIPLFVFKNGERAPWEEACGELKEAFFGVKRKSTRRNRGHKRWG